MWTSPVVQGLRIHLPMQGTRVRSLAQEDFTCRGAAKPMQHNYRSLSTQAPQQEKPAGREAPARHTRESPRSKEHPRQPKIKNGFSFPECVLIYKNKVGDLAKFTS